MRRGRTIALVLLVGAVAAVVGIAPFYGSLARSWERAQLRNELEGPDGIEERVQSVIEDEQRRPTFFDLVAYELASSNVAHRRHAALLARIAANTLLIIDNSFPDNVVPWSEVRRAIHDPDGEVCAHALAALAEAGLQVSDEVVRDEASAIESLLGSEISEVRRNAFRLFVFSAGITEARQASFRMVKDASPQNRAEVFDHLRVRAAELGEADALQLICAGIRDTSARVRDSAHDALRYVGAIIDPAAFFEEIKAEDHVVKERLTHFFSINRERYLAVFAAGLSDAEPAVRSWSGRTLFQMGPDAAAPPAAVESALRGDDRLGRVWGIDCALLMEPLPERLLLEAALSAPDPEVRMKAVRGLSREGMDRALAVPALGRALADGESTVRIAAAVSLLSLEANHSAAARELAGALEDTSGRYARFALREVRRAGENVSIVPALEKARGSPEEDIRSLAEAALSRMEKDVKEAQDEEGEKEEKEKDEDVVDEESQEP